ncbi:MAG TPA: trimethyllysine dioxygenase [Stellaceae bacterium]|nr:trimethyllysine dioxygenase [Stellaceae bacterium]
MTAMLRSATLRGKEVELSWGDGHPDATVSLFWLRDHCLSPATHHPETRQRLIDTFAIPHNIAARAVSLEEDGRALRVDWAEEDLVSRFEASYLADLRDDPEVLPIRRRLWDSAEIEASLPQVPYEGMIGDDAVLKDFLEKVEAWGFCFVEGVPGVPEATQEVAKRVTYIRETIFGGYWDFTANMEHKDTAYTSMAIGPHTDGTYSFDAPGYQMFHCLAAECTGGENILIDGFKVAEIIEREHPDDYEVLTAIAIPGQYLDHERGIHLMARRPLLRLDGAGRLVQVSYNNHDRAPFALPPARQKAFYKALGTFARLCGERSLQYYRRLLPGTVLLFDNWRVLHARTAYTGYRRLSGVYLNKEDVESRLRVLRIKAGEPV